MLKKLKMDSASTTRTPAATSSTRRTTVEDVSEDGEAEIDFAPGGDADYFEEEDDEGRFYGGGLTSEQKEILNIFDKAEGNVHDDEVCR